MSGNREHHLLNIEDETGKRTIPLDAATYSIGRDVTNAIVIHGHTVSRQHALLLRIPSPNGYRYRVVDGNADGKPSANGILVNGQRVQSHELKDGDEINFGGSVKAHYATVSMGEAEFIKYLKSVNYHSIKAVPMTSTITQAEEGAEEETEFNATPPSLPANATPESAPAPKSSPPWLLIVGGIVIVLLITGIGVVTMNRPPAPQPEPPTQTQ
ncbi:FHA domain-containing protein [Thermosynechococcus sp. QKsg1]|uniref:FHA domain-containing protein n=1 Tax=unclassified Thermosynechococcus TaxID=2622553 RepID=UPI00122DF286|nr:MULTISPECIES: FHA domain-containing protein [unclassified Thermosynechococcus]QEQ01427.1 FHA domain-containing protein [Thermosynechococcus sp. CL-1]WJI25797.1 FHA domain-containing protein [Thermosynechococcus sp. B1]WKT82885.1 FHA domain-containing protein [Thermosynechococcus sp. HY596]WNC62012.1 FHA domain-containing protein [Thermosynechococcus sp. HY591]WNC64565.1 FHA domain-containing protein [Thermosynechococcus sp. HY593]